MKTKVELLEECCDIKDAACVRYQKRIEELEKENNKLKKEIKNLKLIQETNEKQIQNDIKEREELRKENKKLKEENNKLKIELVEAKGSGKKRTPSTPYIV